jgi:DNA-binding NtrC family response regulator
MVESAVLLGARVLQGDARSQARVAPEDLEATGDDQLVLPYREARERAVAVFEREYLRKLIEACGSVSGAARRAGMDRARFVSLLRKHGLR